jgi:hypothetical protein
MRIFGAGFFFAWLGEQQPQMNTGRDAGATGEKKDFSWNGTLPERAG